MGIYIDNQTIESLILSINAIKDEIKNLAESIRNHAENVANNTDQLVELEKSIDVLVDNIIEVDAEPGTITP